MQHVLIPTSVGPLAETAKSAVETWGSAFPPTAKSPPHAAASAPMTRPLRTVRKR